VAKEGKKKGGCGLKRWGAGNMKRKMFIPKKKKKKKREKVRGGGGTKRSIL